MGNVCCWHTKREGFFSKIKISGISFFVLGGKGTSGQSRNSKEESENEDLETCVRNHIHHPFSACDVPVLRGRNIKHAGGEWGTQRECRADCIHHDACRRNRVNRNEKRGGKAGTLP